MSSDPGWWSRKLGNQPPAPQAYAPAYPQTPQGYQQPQQPQQPQQFDPRQIKVTGENLFEAAKYWQGGEAHQKERYPCPQCGGNHYYSRAPGVTRGPPPAPMCFDCGFNGMFQQGDPATWQAGG